MSRKLDLLYFYINQSLDLWTILKKQLLIFDEVALLNWRYKQVVSTQLWSFSYQSCQRMRASVSNGGSGNLRNISQFPLQSNFYVKWIYYLVHLSWRSSYLCILVGLFYMGESYKMKVSWTNYSLHHSSWCIATTDILPLYYSFRYPSIDASAGIDDVLMGWLKP